MALKSKEDLISAFREIAGERDDDKVIEFIEDITDSVSGDSNQIADLEKRLADNDRMWRERYLRRFSGIVEGDVEKPDEGHADESTDVVDDASDDNTDMTTDEAVADIFGIEEEDLK